MGVEVDDVDVEDADDVGDADAVALASTTLPTEMMVSVLFNGVLEGALPVATSVTTR